MASTTVVMMSLFIKHLEEVASLKALAALFGVTVSCGSDSYATRAVCRSVDLHADCCNAIALPGLRRHEQSAVAQPTVRNSTLYCAEGARCRTNCHDGAGRRKPFNRGLTTF